MDNLSTIEEKVVYALEIAGINAPIQLPNDTDLSLYIEDSLEYVNLIITLEEILNTALPDEILVFENFQSLIGLINMIKEIGDKNVCESVELS